MEEQTLRLLKTVEKTSAFGRDTVGFVSGKVDNPFLAKELRSCHAVYSKTRMEAKNKLDDLGANSGETSPKTIKMVRVAMKSHLKRNHHAPATAKMLIDGFTMGSIELCRALNNNTLASEDTRTLAQSLVDFHRNSITKMQQYL